MTHSRILLVDDSPLDAELTCLALGEQGLQQIMHVTLGGQEAVDYLKCCLVPQLPELLLLDLKMPGVDGLAVLAHIRNTPNLAALRVVILTTSDEARDRETCIQGGADAFVRKSTHLHNFVQAMREVTRSYLGRVPVPGAG